ncbi:MAG: 30S ribosomal protein S16 [Nitrospiraceae bacterium]
MAVHLRLSRAGRHKLPFYRLVAADSRSPRDGRYLEILGTYNPLKNPAMSELKSERVQHWISVGAQPTTTVRTILRRAGVIKAAPAPAAAAAKAPAKAKAAAKSK